MEIHGPIHALRASIEGLTQQSESTLPSLETLSFTILKTRCQQRCPYRGHTQGMGRELGAILRSLLVNRAQHPVRQLKRLCVSECMAVEGLEDLTDEIESKTCRCSSGHAYVNTSSDLEGWHDPWESGSIHMLNEVSGSEQLVDWGDSTNSIDSTDSSDQSETE